MPCHRSHPRLFHHGPDRLRDRRGAGPVRMARPTLQGGTSFDTVSRESALLLSNVFLVGSTGRRVCGHALSAGAGRAHPWPAEDLGGPALVRAHLRAHLLCASVPGAVRSAIGLAAGRPQGQPASAQRRRLGLAARSRLWWCWRWPARAALAGRLCVRGGGLADQRLHSRCSSSAGRAPAAFAAALAHAGLGITLMGVTATIALAQRGAGP